VRRRIEEDKRTNEQLRGIAQVNTKDLAAYIADYIAEEMERNPFEFTIDRWLIANAIAAYEGGAAEGEAA